MSINLELDEKGVHEKVNIAMDALIVAKETLFSEGFDCNYAVQGVILKSIEDEDNFVWAEEKIRELREALEEVRRLEGLDKTSNK